MQCSYCGTPLPAGSPFCPNCGRPTTPANPTNPTSYSASYQGASNIRNEATPTMNFGPLQETSSVSPDVAPPSSPAQPYQSQQPLSNQQPHMIFGSGSQQVYPQPGVPPQQQPHPPNPQYQQYPQQPPATFGSGQGYSQAGPPPQQPGMFAPGQPASQSYSSPVSSPQQQSGTFGQEQRYPAMNMPQQQSTYPQGYYAQPGNQPLQLRRRSSLSTGVIVLLIILVIAIIGGGGIVLYATVLLPASQHAQTNAKPATQTKTPSLQPTASITTTNPQDLYTQVISRTPTLNDPLTGQDANDWQNLSTLSSCTFTAGVLHLSGSAGSCIGESTNFGDFAYQVKMTIIKGDLGGIAFRVDAINRKLYFFTINPDGLYIVAFIGGGSTSSGNQKILAAANSSAITTGLNQQNTLTVIARSSSIFIYINTQYVTTLTDSSSTIGAIGMLSGSSSGGTSDVVFSDAQVWTL